MDKNKLIHLFETAVEDYKSFLNNKDVNETFKPCEFGFCWYFKRKGFKKDYDGFSAIIAELEKDKIGENHDDDHWYPTIFYDGYSVNKSPSVVEKISGLYGYKVSTNNRILQKQIDHLERTITRLRL